MKAHGDLIKTDQKWFDCDICYLQCDIRDIALLQQCGHYFCKNCLQDYYNFMINVSGQVQKIKCPNANCRIQINTEEVHNLLGQDTY